MLVSFLGSPSSGKTTVAAGVFSSLKKSQLVCELVLEFARFKIAENRKKTNSSNLSKQDQLEIFIKQCYNEKIMSGSHITISDSSPVNNLLYIEDWKNDSVRIDLLKKHLAVVKPVFFLCHPVDCLQLTSDLNRIHSQEESRNLHLKFQEILSFFEIEAIPLVGSIEEREVAAINGFLEKLT